MRRIALVLGLIWTPSALAAVTIPQIELQPYHAQYTLTNGRSDWTDTGVVLDVRERSRFAWSVETRETKRFGLRDREVGAYIYTPLRHGWAASLNATVSDTYRVLPQHSLQLLLQNKLGDGWIAQGGLRHSVYRSEYADLRVLTVERYFGNEFVLCTIYSGKPESGGSAASYRVAWVHYFGQRATIGVSLARGREVEDVAPQELLVSDVHDVTLSASYWFSRNWGARFDVESQQLGTLYRRDGILAAIQYRF